MFILSKYDSIHQLLHNFGENQVLHNRHYEKFADGTVKDIEDEIPFEVPEGWAWCRLSEIAELKGGKRIPAGMSATKDKTDHIYIRVSDMKNDTISTDDLRYISDTIFEQIKQYIIGKNDLYLTIAGTIGRVGEVPELFDKMNLTENALKITNIKLNKRYLLILLKSPFVQDYFEGTYHQVAMPKLSLTNASKTLLPIPSMNTQKLIVERYFSLNEKIDTLDSNKETLEQAIKQAKSKILDLAIHGKLVPQDSSDEPASVLLEKLRAEKEAKIKAGELKRDKNDSYIYKSTTDNCYYEKFQNGTEELIEVPYNLPESWSWSRLGSICDYGKCKNASVDELNDKTWVLDLEDIEKDTGKILKFETLETRNSLSTKHVFKKGDILYSKLRPYLNKVVIAPKDGVCTSEILPLDFNGILINEYAQYLLMSSYFLTTVNLVTYGVKMPRLGTDDAKKMLLPVPPLNEQLKIICSVKKLQKSLDEIILNLV